MRQVVCVLFSVALSIVLMSCAGEDFDGLTFKSVNANDEDSVEHPTLESYIKDSRQISDSRYVSFLNPNEKGSLDTVVILTNQEHVLYLKEGSFYYRGSGCSDSNVVAENDTLFVNYGDDKKMDYLPYQKIPLLDTGVLKKALSPQNVAFSLTFSIFYTIKGIGDRKMAEANVVFQMFKSLSDKEKETFLRLLGMPTELTEIIDSTDTEEFLAKHRFPNQEVCCVHCGLLDVCKCGHTKSGHQRFRCKGCGKTFTYASRTIFNGAKKELDMYFQYIHCMMRGMTIRDSAKECHITKNNSFYLRHKILDALQEMQDKVRLDGIVEADETYFPISFKGNHSKSKTFVMPREAHKRGERAKKRGISKEKVCVACAVNRSGKSIANISNLGRPSVASISAVLGGRISPDSVLCTDKMNSYVPFAEHEGINVIQLKSTKRVDGMFSIQHINNYHSQLKKFIDRFNGVSTKYLNNYLVWHNLKNYADGDRNFKESVWCKHSADAVYDDSKWTYMFRSPIPLPIVA